MGYYYPDELYHHGIKGQKWGIRRFQNEDGTLTPAGKERYGNKLGEYATKNGAFRKLVSGDHILGRKGIADRLELRYKRKSESAKQQGLDDEAKNYDKYYKAQRQRNIDRDIYLSKVSTGKILLQNILLGIGADSYRVERTNQKTIGEAAIAGIVTNIPYVGLPAYVGVDAYNSIKRYGKVTL